MKRPLGVFALKATADLDLLLLEPVRSAEPARNSGMTGTMASTVNPFSIGVASGEAGVSIGDGIVLRVLLWVVLTAVAVVFVVRYARRVQRDPSRSLVGFDSETDSGTDIEPGTTENGPPPDEKLSGVQKSVLAITVFTFGLMNPLLHSTLALSITAVPAALSWFLVEKPALTLKPRGKTSAIAPVRTLAAD